MATRYSAPQPEKSASMENLKRLQECNKRNMSFKQAFFQLGMTGFNKTLRELNEEEEFSALVNWTLNKLPPFHSIDLRHKVNGEIYQTSIHKSERGIRVGKPTFKTNYIGAIMYDWPEEMKYETLNVDAITNSITRADAINLAKTQEGSFIPVQRMPQLLNPKEEEGLIELEQQQQVASQQISLIQTDRNCWNVVLTEEERNLLGELLDI